HHRAVPPDQGGKRRLAGGVAGQELLKQLLVRFAARALLGRQPAQLPQQDCFGRMWHGHPSPRTALAGPALSHRAPTRKTLCIIVSPTDRSGGKLCFPWREVKLLARARITVVGCVEREVF